MQHAAQEDHANDRVVLRVAKRKPVAQEEDERRREPLGAQIGQRCRGARAHEEGDPTDQSEKGRKDREGKARPPLGSVRRPRQARGRDEAGHEAQAHEQRISEDDRVRDLPQITTVSSIPRTAARRVQLEFRLRMDGGPAWIRTRDQGIMSPLL